MLTSPETSLCQMESWMSQQAPAGYQLCYALLAKTRRNESVFDIFLIKSNGTSHSYDGSVQKSGNVIMISAELLVGLMATVGLPMCNTCNKFETAPQVHRGGPGPGSYASDRRSTNRRDERNHRKWHSACH